MPVEKVLDALIRLERRMKTEPVKAQVKGMFRPRIVLGTLDGDVLCEIRSGLIFFGVAHQARCNILETDASIHVAGFFTGSLGLRVDGSPVLGVEHRPFPSRYLVQDWKGASYQIRRRGRPWNRRFELAEAAPGESLIQFGFAPLRIRSSLSISPQADVEPGVVAGLTLLLYYEWYLGLRFVLLS